MSRSEVRQSLKVVVRVRVDKKSSWEFKLLAISLFSHGFLQNLEVFILVLVEVCRKLLILYNCQNIGQIGDNRVPESLLWKQFVENLIQTWLFARLSTTTFSDSRSQNRKKKLIVLGFYYFFIFTSFAYVSKYKKWSWMVYGGAKRRKGEDWGGGNSLPQVGCRGSPPPWKKVWENCIKIVHSECMLR